MRQLRSIINWGNAQRRSSQSRDGHAKSTRQRLYLRYGSLSKQRPTDTTLLELKQRGVQEVVTEPPTESLEEQVERLPNYQRWILSNVEQYVSEEEVRQLSWEKRKLTIATDGGLKDSRGTFGWTLSTSDNKTLHEGSGPVDGPIDVANSTRCEIAGLVAPYLIYSSPSGVPDSNGNSDGYAILNRLSPTLTNTLMPSQEVGFNHQTWICCLKFGQQNRAWALESSRSTMSRQPREGKSTETSTASTNGLGVYTSDGKSAEATAVRMAIRAGSND